MAAGGFQAKGLFQVKSCPGRPGRPGVMIVIVFTLEAPARWELETRVLLGFQVPARVSSSQATQAALRPPECRLYQLELPEAA